MPPIAEPAINVQTVDTLGQQNDFSGNEGASAIESHQLPQNEVGYQNGGDVGSGLVHDATAAPTDAEPHGTGIKEDG